MSNETKQVRTGVHVDIELINARGEREPMRVVIVRGESADLESGVLASSAPLAKAILGKRAGVEVPYRRGDIVAVRIVRIGEVVAVDAAVDADEAAARRQEAVKKAVDDAERTNAAIFASSFTSKWGGYDAGDPIDWEDKETPKAEDNGQTQA